MRHYAYSFRWNSGYSTTEHPPQHRTSLMRRRSCMCAEAAAAALKVKIGTHFEANQNASPATTVPWHHPYAALFPARPTAASLPRTSAPAPPCAQKFFLHKRIDGHSAQRPCPAARRHLDHRRGRRIPMLSQRRSPDPRVNSRHKNM